MSETDLVAMVLLAFNSRLTHRTPIFTQPPAGFVFIFQRMAIFIGNSVEAEHWFLGAPGAKSKPALRQGIVFFCLRPRVVTHVCFSLCNCFSCETCSVVSVHESECTRRSIGRSIFRQVPKLHSCASVCPGACFRKLVMQSRHPGAWLQGCPVSYEGAHEPSVS